VVVDKWVVDGIVARVTAWIVRLAGSALRYSQTGRVQAYAFTMVLGLGGVGWFFMVPHASHRLKSDDREGKYVVELTPGAGYDYRWDENGDGKWDGDFGNKREVAFTLDGGQSKRLRFQ